MSVTAARCRTFPLQFIYPSQFLHLASECRAVAWLECTRFLAVAGDDGGLFCCVGHEQMLKLLAHPARTFGVFEVEQNLLVTAANYVVLRAWAYNPFTTKNLSEVSHGHVFAWRTLSSRRASCSVLLGGPQTLSQPQDVAARASRGFWPCPQ